MKKQTPSLQTEEKSSSVHTEKKSWHAPKMTELNVQETKGGCIDINWEDPYCCIFSS